MIACVLTFEDVERHRQHGVRVHLLDDLGLLHLVLRLRVGRDVRVGISHCVTTRNLCQKWPLNTSKGRLRVVVTHRNQEVHQDHHHQQEEHKLPGRQDPRHLSVLLVPRFDPDIVEVPNGCKERKEGTPFVLHMQQPADELRRGLKRGDDTHCEDHKWHNVLHADVLKSVITSKSVRKERPVKRRNVCIACELA